MAKVNTYVVTYTYESKDESIEVETEILMEDGDDVETEMAKAHERVARNVVDIKNLTKIK